MCTSAKQKQKEQVCWYSSVKGTAVGQAAVSSKICKELLLSCRQGLLVPHGGQSSVVVKIASIINSLDNWPEHVTLVTQ